MDFSPTAIVNDALALAGCAPFQGADDDLEAHPLYRTFNNMLVHIETMHNWRFTKTTKDLAQDPSHQVTRYDFAYHLPEDLSGDILEVWEVRSEGRHLYDYEVEGRYLLTDAETVALTYQIASTLDAWPGYFRQLLVTAVAAQYALQEREDKTMHDRLWTQAFGTPQEGGRGGLFRQAASRDTQVEPARGVRIGPDPISNARYGSRNRLNRWWGA